MAGTAEQAHAESGRRPAKHVHHGRTPAAWVGTGIATVAIFMGGIALVLQNWPLFWVAAALLVVSLVVAKVMQTMGYGAY